MRMKRACDWCGVEIVGVRSEVYRFSVRTRTGQEKFFCTDYHERKKSPTAIAKADRLGVTRIRWCDREGQAIFDEIVARNRDDNGSKRDEK
jgi:hypothetical protein